MPRVYKRKSELIVDSPIYSTVDSTVNLTIDSIVRFLDSPDSPVPSNSPNQKRKYTNYFKDNLIPNFNLRFVNSESLCSRLSDDLKSRNLIILHNNNFVIIQLDGYSILIEIESQLGNVNLSLIDSSNKYIELRAIGFYNSIKVFWTYEMLINEIVRILSLNYNIKCLNEEKVLEKKLSELNYSIDKTRELYVTIRTSIGDACIVLYYPHDVVGNRGTNFGDPDEPFIIKSDFENIKRFRKLIPKHGSRNQRNLFKSIVDLITYFEQFNF